MHMKSLILVAYLACLRYATGFVLSRCSHYAPRSTYHNQMLFMCASSDWEFDTSLIPNSFDACQDAMLASVEFLHTNMSGSKRYSLDLLTPGLNPKLEQKAIMRIEYTFSLLTGLLESLSAKHETTLFMFQSMGDAAGFKKYCSQAGVDIPENVALTELDKRYIAYDDIDISCALIIKAKNHVGDPVLHRMREICDEISPNTLYLMLNCDWTDRVATGSQTRNVRDAFRASIKPLFYYRNIVEIARPSLTPYERGAIYYNRADRGDEWGIYTVDDTDILGPGSLNRFINGQAVFMRKERDPNAMNPPGFFQVKSFDTAPKRDEIDKAISRGDFLLEKRKRDIKRGVSGESKGEQKERKGWFQF